MTARDRHVLGFLEARAEELQHDLGLGATLQSLDDFFGGVAASFPAVDFEDLVATAQTGLVSRSRVDRTHDREVAVLVEVDERADAAVLAIEVEVEPLELLTGEERAVRVEPLQHALGSVFDHFLIGDVRAANVLNADAVPQFVEHLVVIVAATGFRAASLDDFAQLRFPFAALFFLLQEHRGTATGIGRLVANLAQDLPGATALGVDLGERQGSALLQVAITRLQELLEHVLGGFELPVATDLPQRQRRFDAHLRLHQFVFTLRQHQLAHVGQDANVEQPLFAEQRQRCRAQELVAVLGDRLHQSQQVLAERRVFLQLGERQSRTQTLAVAVARAGGRHDRRQVTVEIPFGSDVSELVGERIDFAASGCVGLRQDCRDLRGEFLGPCRTDQDSQRKGREDGRRPREDVSHVVLPVAFGSSHSD